MVCTPGGQQSHERENLHINNVSEKYRILAADLSYSPYHDNYAAMLSGGSCSSGEGLDLPEQLDAAHPFQLFWEVQVFSSGW